MDDLHGFGIRIVKPIPKIKASKLKNKNSRFIFVILSEKKEPVELLPLDVDRLRLKLQKKGHKTTAARIIELLRRTLNYGTKKGLTPPIGFKIEVPRLNNQKTEDLTEAQITSLALCIRQGQRPKGSQRDATRHVYRHA